ncbi:MAG TPA: TonB-dependent receptor, partial [Bacteroidales bacterium]|nr:TonB-dependent receptor [Bacteroidales bacterium]
MKKFLFSICLLTIPFVIFSQTVRHTISGFVREDVSGESLIGVNIYVPQLKTGTTTNTYGFYSLTLPSSTSVDLVFSYVGFVTQTITTALTEDTEINIALKPGVTLGEVTINADKVEKQSESVKMSTINLQPAQIKNVPALLGEKDVLKVIQLMPGVQKGSEGSSGIYVRGGGPDQNLIILDDAIVYNASHLFGFFSLFNGDALKSVELTKGGFPARYGGRLSSVLEMNMKDG